MSVRNYYKTLINVLVKPEKTFKKLQKTTLTEGIIAVILGSLVTAVILAFFSAILNNAFLSIPYVGAYFTGLMNFISFGIIIALPIAVLIFWAICGLYYWIISKILGGKGEPEKFLAVFGYVIGALMLVMWIPLVNVIAALYFLFLLYTMLKPTMKMKPDKALLVIIVAIIVKIVLQFGMGWSILV